MTRSVLSLVVAIASLLPAGAFSPYARMIYLPGSATHSRTLTPSCRLNSTPNDRQAEIAALEEKLRQLKQENDIDSMTSSSASGSFSGIESKGDDSFILEGESEDSIMFSERWKEAETTTQEVGGLMNVALALGFVVLLTIFSQIPVGEEDLTRYQGKQGDVSRIDLGDLNPGVRVQ
mmetsp:Transcript_30577/g.63579  ORF Transcript_30577/g.63579 Transcript_30577/m.63579 type:complete len:177 (+) Transcript_30577:37-567(+)|eukprot:CAMPEP_0171332424 /NCGR_PEP_ID=MMETSP0878-20121228/3344_1 /TAXON_ID=67004 /ORGANISM="Thalassiosira weissflogii, Strain CCMP1336" /LENGTH=176 /DNA_ID=CAMNT_0011833149 /DNA_START=26 /DNA_END=556 /DNA_ORIENTATION=-